ncbi:MULTISPECIES: YncE family protein [unclassified Pseudomonas]
MDIQSSALNQLFVLYPVIIPGWISPLKTADPADGGIPKSLYDEQPQGLECLVDPWAELQSRSWKMAVDDRVDLYINSETTPVAGKTIVQGEEQSRIRLYVPHGRLPNGVSRFHYKVTRPSGHSEDSRDLNVLYYLRSPGEPAPQGLDLVIPPDVLKDGVDAARAAQGVEFGFNFSNPRPYNRIRFQTGDETDEWEITDASAPVTRTLFEDTFRRIGDSRYVQLDYLVFDHLGNFNRSSTKLIDVHLGRLDTQVAFSNGPYDVAPGGRVKDVKLSLTRSGQPAVGKITVVLPVGSQYADGAGGTREFSTQPDGTLIIEGIKGATAGGVYTLMASSGGHTTTETLTVMAYAQPGVIAVGALIQGITISSDGRRAYVGPANGRSLAVIDTEKAKVERYIPINGQDSSSQHALSRDGTRAFAGFYQTQLMEILDLESERTIASFPVGRACFNVTLSQDEALAFVSNSHDATVNVIDVRNLQSLKTITVGQAPNQIVVHPDGSRIYVAVVSSSSIVVIDSRSLTQIAAFRLKAPPIGLAMSPDGNSIFADVVVSTTEEIVQVNAHNGALIRAIPVTGLARGIVVNHRGTRAYCCNPHTHTVSTIDIQSGAVIQRIPVGRLPLRMAISPDDSLGYVSCHEDGTVWVISLQPVLAGGLDTPFGGVLEHVEPGSVKPVPGDEYLGLPG